MNLLETLALLTFILALLSLVVDVIRLTVEVMAKFSQMKSDDNKKDYFYQYFRFYNSSVLYYNEVIVFIPLIYRRNLPCW